MNQMSLASIKENLGSKFLSKDPFWPDFIAFIKKYYSRQKFTLLEDAYYVAAYMHKDQKRKSGEPYIIHPIEVTKIIAELGLSIDVLAAGLLHDVVEDTDFPLEQINSDFGDTIAFLVDGVTKIDRLKFGSSAEAETIRKMIIAMTQDIRVIIIKLCDRLHNARTWKYVPQASAIRKARQTLEVYSPLAERLGLQAIKLELENLSFAVSEPKVYSEIVRLVEKADKQREEYVQSIVEKTRQELSKLNIAVEISGRPKHFYSIYKKMLHKQLDFAEIYDLTGIRILTNTIRDCYVALGVIHTKWVPIPARFKDYIAMPKSNMYQSLHTGVIGPDGKPVEFQIRTKKMHQAAEYGIAAHWKYKEAGASVKAGEVQISSEWLKQLSADASESTTDSDFFSLLSNDLNEKEVYVFTPQGATKTLPAGSTPVDFAYSVHTEVGDKTTGSKINGKLVPLDTKLKSGDTVEILTSNSPTAGPSKHWENFVASSRARNKIRQYFTRARQDEALENGKERLVNAARKQGLPLKSHLSKEALNFACRELNYKDIDSLFIALGGHQLTAEKVLLAIVAHKNQAETIEAANAIANNIDNNLDLQLHETSKPKVNSNNSGVMVKGNADILVKLAKCCTPVPPDRIVGFITRGFGISVHRSNCKSFRNLKQNEPQRVVEVSWIGESSGDTFSINMRIEVINRKDMFSEIAQVLSHDQVLIETINTTHKKGELQVFINLTVQISDIKQLESAFHNLRSIEGVVDVVRK